MQTSEFILLIPLLAALLVAISMIARRSRVPRHGGHVLEASPSSSPERHPTEPPQDGSPSTEPPQDEPDPDHLDEDPSASLLVEVPGPSTSKSPRESSLEPVSESSTDSTPIPLPLLEGQDTPILIQDMAAEIPLDVLLAEDTAVNQLLIRRVFAQMGYDITVVDNGRAAVEQAREQRFDLILMDIQMPEMDGIEACHRILAEAQGRAGEPPVVVAVTANASDDNRDLCRAAGMQDFIAKPFTLEQLQRVVARMGEHPAQ